MGGSEGRGWRFWADPKDMRPPYVFPELQTFYLINNNERLQIYLKMRVDHEVQIICHSEAFSDGNSKEFVFLEFKMHVQ